MPLQWTTFAQDYLQGNLDSPQYFGDTLPQPCCYQITSQSLARQSHVAAVPWRGGGKNGNICLGQAVIFASDHVFSLKMRAQMSENLWTVCDKHYSV